MTSTMRGYLDGLQRAFADVWAYRLSLFEGPVFACPKRGFLSVVDNKFSARQASGDLVTSHNDLSQEDLLKLFSSDFLSRSTPFGYQARLVFGIGISTAMRPSALASLSMKQFKKITLEGERVWTIQGVIGSRNGASKTNMGGLSAVRDRPTEVCVYDKALFERDLNLFEDIDEYMLVRQNMESGTDQFFLAANPRGTRLDSFFKRQHLGKNSFSRIIQDVCGSLGIKGSGHAYGFTAHGLRGTVVSMLYEAGCSDASVAQRTGHRERRSLKSYHNLRGALGRQQQDAIFGNDSKRPKIGVKSEGKENNPRESKVGCAPSEQVPRRDEGNDAFLSRIQSMSGCSLTFNVNHH